ncbi:MAG: hypothetical protein ACOYB7_02500 [Mycobacterium sp.]
MAPIVAADWIAGHPGAVDRVRALADHATDIGEVTELVEALLACLPVALGAGNRQLARRRLELRAVAAADAQIADAVADGRYRSLEGR